MSLFGENSRLIGSIYSWVDVPGAEHNLIRQATAAGLWGEKGSPLVHTELARSKKYSYGDCWTYENHVSQELPAWQLFVYVCMCMFALMWM